MWDRRQLWLELKQAVQARWAALTDEDVLQFDGHKEVLIAKVQQRCGVDRQSAQQDVEAWLSNQPC